MINFVYASNPKGRRYWIAKIRRGNCAWSAKGTAQGIEIVQPSGLIENERIFNKYCFGFSTPISDFFVYCNTKIVHFSVFY